MKKIIQILLFFIIFFETLLISIFIIQRINIKSLFDKEFLFQYKNYNLMKKFFINQSSIQNYNYNFAIITRNYNCTNGLFAFYINYISCLHKYINNGYIPILDLSSFPNVFNQFKNKSIENDDDNPWEYFFNQPFDYKLRDVKKYAKKIIYINCHAKNKPNTNIFNKKFLLTFWHDVALKYIPIKNEILNESNKIRKKLFHKSNNVLGILIRGTDYISMKPKGHPIQPNPKIVIKDVKKMDKSNRYDWFFLTTEDNLIRNLFIISFGKKLKYIKYNNLEYNYNKKEYFAFNIKTKDNINFMKIYLINIIILSKCIDIICSRTAGSVGAFIFSNGFRNVKVYFLGRYK